MNLKPLLIYNARPELPIPGPPFSLKDKPKQSPNKKTHHVHLVIRPSPRLGRHYSAWIGIYKNM